MKIRIHSLSSTITNSSTTVFCYASESGMTFIKDIINQVLKDGGSKKVFDDLYDIQIEYDDNLYEVIADDHYDEWKDLDWPKTIEKAKQYLKDNPDEKHEHWTGLNYPTHYIVTVKDGNKDTVLNKVNKLFDYEGFRDG